MALTFNLKPILTEILTDKTLTEEERAALIGDVFVVYTEINKHRSFDDNAAEWNGVMAEIVTAFGLGRKPPYNRH